MDIQDTEIRLQQLYFSELKKYHYSVISVGQDYTDNTWEKQGNGYVRRVIEFKCADDEVVLLEMKDYGKPVVLKMAALIEAIKNGKMKLTDKTKL